MAAVSLREETGLAILTIDRAEVRNAIDDETMTLLDVYIGALAGRRDLHGVIVTGAGQEAFCAGGDLRWLQGFDTPEAGQRMSRRMQGIMMALSQLPVPVIGVLNGYAYGGGTEIALACDMRVMEAHSFLCFKQVRVGVMTGWGGGTRLLHMVGHARAMELLTLCPRLLPEDARAMGLANRVVPTGEGLAEARRMIAQLARAAPHSVRTTKQLMLASAHLDVAAGNALEAKLFGEVWKSADHDEAVAAFFARRKPEFSGH